MTKKSFVDVDRSTSKRLEEAIMREHRYDVGQHVRYMSGARAGGFCPISRLSRHRRLPDHPPASSRSL